MNFTDDELRVILSVMSQANYPTNMFGIVNGILAKLQTALQPDLQAVVPPTSDGQEPPNRAERRRLEQTKSPTPTE